MKKDVWKVIDDNTFYNFKKKHRLVWNEKKQSWNKEFSPIIKSFIIDKGHATSHTNYISGYTLGKWIGNKCKFCGKFIENNRAKFCESQHRKLFHKILNIGKLKYNFDLNKNNHWLLIPTLYEFSTNKKGEWKQTRNNVKNIERKNMEFVINGKRYPVTTKGGQPRAKNKN
jgi:hypothetical protein